MLKEIDSIIKIVTVKKSNLSLNEHFLKIKIHFSFKLLLDFVLSFLSFHYWCAVNRFFVLCNFGFNLNGIGITSVILTWTDLPYLL